VDKQNLKETSLKSYYADIGYLTQEPSVFDGTVEENLLYAVTKPLPNPPLQGEGIDSEAKNEASSLLAGES
jgi:ABC-type multidrug transport system fused ATPase/permease subunit